MTKANPQELSRGELALTAAFLIALAAWHSGLYAGFLPAPIVPCTENGPSCTGEAQMILGLPIPYLSVVAFAAILVCLLLPKGQRP